MEKLQAIVKKVKTESPTIKRIYFLLDNDWKLEYTAGQYITVFIDGSKVTEGKAYSLSSAPCEEYMSITVKNVGGEFSGYLFGLKKGSRFTVSRAYGFFNPETTRTIVALAAGVGISPIISVLKDQPDGKSHLYYSNKTHKYIPHKDDLARLKVTVNHHITADNNAPDHMAKGRISLDNCVAAVEDAFYMICGSVSFVRDMWQGLVARGIKPEHITTETFFE